ncbi:MAG: phosphatidate cytidylyltransferase [Pseudobacter sp.]|uniref:phosphatidate cytidylyltransferase n=1 Tax=Pseudobacter sp. TaxID=2045420 RepID=UPI003F7D22C4
MKQYPYLITMMLLALVTLSSCEVIGGIFKAGVWVGVLAVVGVVALIIFLISKMGGRK